MPGNLFYPTVLFFLAASAAIGIGQIVTDASIILKILAIFVVILLIFLRLSKPTTRLLFGNKLGQGVFIFSITLFILLLVLSTGGFLSPFFVVIHISTLALSLLTTFGIASSFLIIATLANAFQLYLLLRSAVITFDIPSLIVYFASLIAVVPLSAIVASRYHLRGRLAEYLYGQLFITQTEQSAILGSIEEGIITLDRAFSIVRVNEIAQKLTGFKEAQLKEQPFFSIFSFKDSEGKFVEPHSFPFTTLSKTQGSFRETKLSIKKADGTFFNIDFKVSSILGIKGTVEGFLFIFNDVTRKVVSAQMHTVLETSFRSFFELLSSLGKQAAVDKITRSSHKLLTLHEIISGEISGILSIVDAGELTQEIIQENKELARHFEVSLVYLPEQRVRESLKLQPKTSKNIWENAPYYPNLPIITNRALLKIVLTNLMELGILLSSSQIQKLVRVESIKQNTELVLAIRVLIKDFPWSSMNELYQPFFGKLQDNPLLSQLSGLEGYIARLLVHQLGGAVTTTKYTDEKLGDELVLAVVLSTPIQLPS